MTRRCRHNPLKIAEQRNAKLREKLFVDVVAFARKHNLPMKSIESVRAFLKLCEEFRGGVSWSAMRKAAKLVVQQFGYGTASAAKMWLKMFDACLEVELGCAYPVEVKRLNREYRKKNPLPPMGRPIPPMPLKMNNARLVIDGDLTFDVKPRNRKVFPRGGAGKKEGAG